MVDQPTREKFIAELERTGLVAAACRAVGVGRATVYRWKDEDKAFERLMDEAAQLGRADWCDLAESKLLGALKRGEPWAIRYVLEFNSSRYYKPRKPKNAPKEQVIHSKLQLQVINSDGSYVDEKGVPHLPKVHLLPQKPEDG